MNTSLEELEAELARQDEELEDTLTTLARTPDGRRLAPKLEGLRRAAPAARRVEIPLTALRG